MATGVQFRDLTKEEADSEGVFVARVKERGEVVISAGEVLFRLTPERRCANVDSRCGSP